MNKHLFLTIVFFSLLSQAQEYTFISKEFIKIDNARYLDFVQKKADNKIFNENGSTISIAKMDSLKKAYQKQPYKPFYFGDSINNKSITVIHYLSKEEYKAIGDGYQEAQKKDALNREKLKGSTIKYLNLKDIDGTNYSFDNLKDKIIVLNFWYTKCSPCIQEMPDLNKLKEKYKDKSVAFFSITFDKKNIVEEFLKKVKLDFNVIPNDKKTIDQFGIQFYPTNLIINQNKEVIFVNEFFGNGVKEMGKILKKLTKD